MSRLNCIVIILTALAALAQEPDAKVAKIEGHVQDSVTGQPVRKAAVVLREDRTRQAEGLAVFTDPSGHFGFSNLAPGNWSAEIHRNGYVTLGSFEDGSAKQIHWKLESGTDLRDLKFTLTPAGAIAGRVLDVDGEPVAGASIGLSAPGAKKNSRPLSSAQTNDLGEYRLFNIEPGKYTVSADYEPSWHHTGAHLVEKPPASGKNRPREGYMTTYYPGAGDASQASPVVVTAGAQLSGIDIRLARGAVVRVHGRVTGAAGPLVMVTMMPFETAAFLAAGRVSSAIAKPDGSFEIDNVLPGRYWLQGNGGFDTAMIAGKQRIEVGSEDVEGIQLAMSRPQKIEGRIRMEESGRLPEGLQAVLVPREENPTNQAGGFAAVRPDGSFTFDTAFEGNYDLVLGKFQGEPDDSYVKSIQYGDEDALTGGLDVRGSGAAKIDVILRDDGGTINCKVTTEKGEPAAHAKVMAVPAEPRRNALVLHGQANTDDEGKCQMRGMAPGTYFLLAAEGQELPSVREDEAWHRVEKFAVKAEVTARTTTLAEVKLMPASE